MTLNAALWAGSTALTGKAAFAFWTAALLLQCFDRRKIALVWQILLTMVAVAACIASSVYATGTVTGSVWIASAIVAGLCALRDIRQWTKTSPRETYEEIAQVDPIAKKNNTAAKASRSQAMKAKPAIALPWFDLIGLVIVAVAISIAILASATPKTYAWHSVAHSLAASTLWSVALFCAIELTFGSAPSSLAAVSWSGTALVAIVCWIVESYIAVVIVLSPIDSTADLQAVAMTRLFAFSILLMDFVVWIIPHRVATFKRTGKATGWVSLTMAAWIGALSLTLLCALPSKWPWLYM